MGFLYQGKTCVVVLISQSSGTHCVKRLVPEDFLHPIDIGTEFTSVHSVGNRLPES